MSSDIPNMVADLITHAMDSKLFLVTKPGPDDVIFIGLRVSKNEEELRDEYRFKDPDREFDITEITKLDEHIIMAWPSFIKQKEIFVQTATDQNDK